MATVMTPVSDDQPLVDFQSVTPINTPVLLASATYVSTDLAKTRALLEEFLGLECVRHRPDSMLVRDRGWQPNGYHRGKPYWALEVFERPRIDYPQCYKNHWGVELESPEAVARAHRMVERYRDRFIFDHVQDVRDMHGSYGFYFSDADTNWWEVEYTEHRARHFLRRGGFGGDWELRADDGDEISRDNPAITPFAMSHGTIECGGNGRAARTFYAEFLGVGGPMREEFPNSGGFVSRSHWHVACLNVGNEMHAQSEDNRWIFATETPDDVRRFHDTAKEYQRRYRIREIRPVTEEADGSVWCRICDLDGNWFEWQWRDAKPGRWFDAVFEAGDQY